MSEPQLKLVDDLTETELSEIEGEMSEKRKSLARARHGAANTKVLPPDNSVRYDDLANAERFLHFVGEDLLYLAEAKRWLIWDRTRWKFDDEEFVFQLAIDFARNLYSPENCRDDVAFKHAKRSNNRAGINAMLEIAQRMRTVGVETFDTQPFLLNCANGTLDLKTGELRPHSRTDRITRVVNCDMTLTRPAACLMIFSKRSSPIRTFARSAKIYRLFAARNRSRKIFLDTLRDRQQRQISLCKSL